MKLMKLTKLSRLSRVMNRGAGTRTRAAAKQKARGVPRPLATRRAVDLGLGLALWLAWQQGAGAAQQTFL